MNAWIVQEVDGFEFNQIPQQITTDMLNLIFREINSAQFRIVLKQVGFDVSQEIWMDVENLKKRELLQIWSGNCRQVCVAPRNNFDIPEVIIDAAGYERQVLAPNPQRIYIVICFAFEVNPFNTLEAPQLISDLHFRPTCISRSPNDELTLELYGSVSPRHNENRQKNQTCNYFPGVSKNTRRELF